MDIQKELYETEQYKRISYLQDLKNCLEIFYRNSESLGKLIEFGSNPEKAREMFEMKNRIKYQNFMFELSRRIHNYVASSYTLISVTHNVIKRYKKKGEVKFFAEFELKQDELSKKPVYELIYYLRQYYQHLNIPYLGSRYSVDNVEGQETISFTLDKREILEYNELSTTCRTYLKGLADDIISIPGLVENYNLIVTGFFDWVYNNLEVVLKNDIEFVKIKELEIKKYFTPAFIFARIKAIQGGSLLPPEDIFSTLVNEDKRQEIIKNNQTLKDRLIKLTKLLKQEIPINIELEKEIMSLSTGDVLSKPTEINLY